MKYILMLVALLMLATAGAARADDATLKGVTVTNAEVANLLGQGQSCMERVLTPLGKVCCKWCRGLFGAPYCCPKYWADKVHIDYWEASEVIEVSCRTGSSMLAPSAVPSRMATYGDTGGEASKIAQSCVGFSRPGNMHWFFEARDWAINGGDGQFRHQTAVGATNGEKMRQCTMEGHIGNDDLEDDKSWGYGVKWAQFSGNLGSPNGPGGSWEAYISDKDPDWAPAAPQWDADSTSLSECQPGSNDLQNCWGKITQTGWVTHSNPKVAAALVAWRAHLKAAAAQKVSPPDSKGYKMSMEYPYQTYTGDLAASMGLPNGAKVGSQCFQPGDAGPEWYGGHRPDELPALVTKMTPGNMALDAEMNTGTYIFVIWVHTSCTRFRGMLTPTDICHYMDGT